MPSAIEAIEMFEVFVPTIVSSAALSKMKRIVLCLTPRFSATASMTRSHSESSAASRCISAQTTPARIRASSEPFISPVLRIAATAFCARSLPLSSAFPRTISTTSRPARAPQAAMAAPMVPAPTTAIFLMLFPIYAPFRVEKYDSIPSAVSGS